MTEVIGVRFKKVGKVYYFDPCGIQVKNDAAVIVETARGQEYGEVSMANSQVEDSKIVQPLKKLVRVATDADKKTMEQNLQFEKDAFRICEEKIQKHKLDMKLVSVEYTFDRSKILFYFSADGRVDFRELVKDLAGVFRTRIELRQIGVRDEAKMIGGLGICGRPFCCSQFLESFMPVSIKMAKTQNLSLNPTKISGTCGRLMCCLKYEQDAYEDLIRTSPKPESFVDTPEGRGTVVELDLLRQRVKVRMEDRPEVIASFSNTEIAVLRNGKAKKNDAPIPADLAPISGQGKRVRENTESDAPLLDPIRFRYSTESIVDEPEAPVEEEEVAVETAPVGQEKNRRRRNRRNRGTATEDAQAPAAKPEEKPEAVPEAKPHNRKKNHKTPEAKPQAEKKEAPKDNQKDAPKDAPAEEAPAKKRNKHHYYRHRKPKSNGKAEG